MDKEELRQYLNTRNIQYEIVEHPAVFTVEQVKVLRLPHPEAGAKNLFLKDDKKKNYYLVTLRESCIVSIKEIQQKIGSRRLSFASEEELHRLLGLRKGSVTPLGLLNDAERKVQFYLDAYFTGRLIAVHPNENTATIYLQTQELLVLLAEHGSAFSIVDFEGN